MRRYTRPLGWCLKDNEMSIQGGKLITWSPWWIGVTTGQDHETERLLLQCVSERNESENPTLGASCWPDRVRAIIGTVDGTLHGLIRKMVSPHLEEAKIHMLPITACLEVLFSRFAGSIFCYHRHGGSTRFLTWQNSVQTKLEDATKGSNADNLDKDLWIA